MDIRGHGTGPITADAAFTSDFAIPDDIPMQNLADMVEIERRSMDVRSGMRQKYTPLRFDPATGARQVGGRYLFDTWENAVGYNTFTSKELEFEPGVKFCDRLFFLGVDRRIWRVIGAYDFTPLATTHYVNRFERWMYTGGNAERLLEQVWPTVRENAGRQGLASVWLLFQPEEEQIGILTVAAKADGRDLADAASRSVTALEQTESVGRFLPAELGVEKVFDRTSLILAMWLPQSRPAGGAPSAYPAAPVHPLPLMAVSSAVRRTLLVAGSLVLVQAGFGLVVNLYILYPAHHPGPPAGAYLMRAYDSFVWAVGHGTLALAVHAALGLALVLLSIVAAVRAVLLRRRAVAFWTVLGALLVIGAAINGGSFLADGKILSSLLMAVFGLSAEVCYQLAIHLLPSKRHQAC
jgi:hypothetical protein